MDERRWLRKVKAAKVEGQKEIGRPRFVLLDGGEKGFSCQGGRLAGGIAILLRKECLETTCG